MTRCKASDPINGSAPWRPDPHASSRRAHARTRGRARPVDAFFHERFQPAHTRTRPNRRPSRFRTNDFVPRPPEPDRRPQRPNRAAIPSTRARAPRRPGQPARTQPRPLSEPAHLPPPPLASPPAASPLTATPPSLPTPPSPVRPSPVSPHPQPPLARPPSLRSGSRPCAAPGPPSGSLPESRYRPVNATLDSPAASCHGARLLLLSTGGLNGVEARLYPAIARTCEPRQRGGRACCTNDVRRHRRTRASASLLGTIEFDPCTSEPGGRRKPAQLLGWMAPYGIGVPGGGDQVTSEGSHPWVRLPRSVSIWPSRCFRSTQWMQQAK